MLWASDISEDYFFDHIHAHPHLWSGLVSDVCSLNEIIIQDLRPFSDGVNLVACVNDCLVVKIFPPFHMHQWESDSRTLKHLQGRLSLSIPRFVASGELKNSWTYLVMSKLDGVSLEKAWPQLSREKRILLMEDIGKVMAEVHAAEVGELKSLRPGWSQFIEGQVIGCKSRHLKKGMPRWFIDGLESWLNNAIELLEGRSRRVILTGEYTPFNLLVQQGKHEFKLSGMIDFGDAMIGLPEYDLLGPSLFLGSGDPGLIRALFDSYGYDGNFDSGALQRKLLLLQILHRYSDFGSQLRIDAWQERARNFDELAKLIWPI